jgi:hypothetical protein
LFIIGFDKINFPILIIDSSDLSYVGDLKEFAIDPDLHFHEFTNDLELLDSEGNLWSWKYDKRIKSNMSGEINKILNNEEVKELVKIQFEGTKIEEEINMA